PDRHRALRRSPQGVRRRPDAESAGNAHLQRGRHEANHGLDRGGLARQLIASGPAMPKILIVDDQRNMRTTLAMMLRGVGYEVDEAADGDQGRASGATGAFDLVLTDLRMGQQNGIDVLRTIKERQPMTEVIVMTAYGTIESAVEAMR